MASESDYGPGLEVLKPQVAPSLLELPAVCRAGSVGRTWLIARGALCAVGWVADLGNFAVACGLGNFAVTVACGSHVHGEAAVMFEHATLSGIDWAHSIQKPLS